MIRRIDAKAVLTVATLLCIFAVALLRSNHWRVPSSWSDWRVLVSARPASNPEDGIYAMLDAARAGDTNAYLGCFSGPLRNQLVEAAKEDPRFRQHLLGQNSDVQGIAVTVIARPNPEEARARMEYVYKDHDESQEVWLKKEGSQWKITSLNASAPLQPPVPYGTKPTD